MLPSHCVVLLIRLRYKTASCLINRSLFISTAFLCIWQEYNKVTIYICFPLIRWYEKLQNHRVVLRTRFMEVAIEKCLYLYREKALLFWPHIRRQFILCTGCCNISFVNRSPLTSVVILWSQVFRLHNTVREIHWHFRLKTLVQHMYFMDVFVNIQCWLLLILHIELRSQGVSDNYRVLLKNT